MGDSTQLFSLGVEEQFYLVWPGLDSCYRLVDPAFGSRSRAQATSSQTPYLVVLAVVAAVSFAVSLALTYVVLCLPNRGPLTL